MREVDGRKRLRAFCIPGHRRSPQPRPSGPPGSGEAGTRPRILLCPPPSRTREPGTLQARPHGGPCSARGTVCGARVGPPRLPVPRLRSGRPLPGGASASGWRPLPGSPSPSIAAEGGLERRGRALRAAGPPESRGGGESRRCPRLGRAPRAAPLKGPRPRPRPAPPLAPRRAAPQSGAAAPAEPAGSSADPGGRERSRLGSFNGTGGPIWELAPGAPRGEARGRESGSGGGCGARSPEEGGTGPRLLHAPPQDGSGDCALSLTL
ncbi:translation initiation factor IF-2 isoform X1 [Canis lupus dingo]|uniref:translation initiation factor IF-2 isoform X1 n=1 Tax=Canis lupus dingo TaxID=286419 RepID=UPI000DC6736D|nr:translation initiation factor IF-2 isoform X1 [Canis lupus dingo]